MSTQNLADKLRKIQSQTQEVLDILSRDKIKLSADDEFEVEYIFDGVEKGVKKLLDICQRYECRVQSSKQCPVVNKTHCSTNGIDAESQRIDKNVINGAKEIKTSKAIDSAVKKTVYVPDSDTTDDDCPSPSAITEVSQCFDMR